MKEEENNNYYDNIISDNIASEEISFSGQSQNFCICFVDMVNSTKIIQNISDAGEIRKYYSIFINTIAAIARNFGANIIKNIGDCLIFYYPKTSDSTDKSAFKDVIDCVLAMIAANPIINAKLYQEKLQSIKYRISVDYGSVEIARSTTSQSDDLFGSTMNTCAHLNSKALPNGIVIGSNLFQIVKPFLPFSNEDHYHFQKIDKYQTGSDNKYSYPIYSLVSRNDRSNDSILRYYKQEPKFGSSKSYSHSSINNTSKADTQQQRQQLKRMGFFNILAIDDEPNNSLHRWTNPSLNSYLVSQNSFYRIPFRAPSP